MLLQLHDVAVDDVYVSRDHFAMAEVFCETSYIFHSQTPFG
jgi:hypothetical protein